MPVHIPTPAGEASGYWLVAALRARARIIDAADRLLAVRPRLASPPRRAPRVPKGAVLNGRVVAAPPARRWLARAGRWAPLTLEVADGELAGVRWVKVGDRVSPAIFATAEPELGLRVVADGAAAEAELLQALERRYAVTWRAVEDNLSAVPSLIAAVRDADGPAASLRPQELDDREPVIVGLDADAVGALARRGAVLLPLGRGHTLALARVSIGRGWRPALALLDSRDAGESTRPFDGDHGEMLTVALRELAEPPWRKPAEPPAPEPVDHNPAPRRWAVLAVLGLAAFLFNVDHLVVIMALADLQAELGADAADLAWGVGAFTLALACLLPAAGRLGDRFGRKRAMLIGLIVFWAASLVAMRASSAELLIGARLAQGAGAAAVWPSALATIRACFPARTRATALAAWAAAGGVGLAAGMLIGGWLVSHFWWGSVFLINLPVVAVLAIGVALIVPETYVSDERRLDLGGIVFATLAFAAAVWALIDAPERGWSTAPIVGAFALALVAAVTWVWWERRALHPMIDLARFRDRRFASVTGALALSYLVLVGTLPALTLYYRVVRGDGPLETGLALVPVTGSILVSAFIAVAIARRSGPRPVVFTGLAMIAVGLLVVATVEVDTAYWRLAGAEILCGIGMGCVIAPAQSAVMASLSSAVAGVGMAMVDAFRHLGSTLGVAVAATVVSLAYRGELADASGLDRLPPGAAEAARESVGGAARVAGGLDAPAKPRGALPGSELRQQAFDAFMTGFHRWALVAAAVAVLGSIVVAVVMRRHGGTAIPSIAQRGR